MFSNYLSTIENISKYPEFSLILFVTFFVIVIIKTMKMDKELVDEMSSLPLDKDKTETKQRNENEK